MRARIKSVRRLRPLVLLVLAAGIIAVGSWAAERSSGAPQVQAYAKGALSLRNSRAGEPIFSASNLRPGSSVTGTVTITNAGRAPGSLALSAHNLHDTPGPNGGRLSLLLDLWVEDITGGSRHRIYAGRLAAMPAQTLGCMRPGRKWTYRFTVTFPDSGRPSSARTADNAFQGSSVRVDYLWKLTATNSRQCGGHPPGPPMTSTLGARLVKRFYNDLQHHAVADLRAFLSPAFQIQRAGGSHLKKAGYLKKLPKIRSYKIRHLVTTSTGTELVSTYELAATEIVNGKQVHPGYSPRLSVFAKTRNGWQILAHVDFKTPK